MVLEPRFPCGAMNLTGKRQPRREFASAERAVAPPRPGLPPCRRGEAVLGASAPVQTGRGAPSAPQAHHTPESADHVPGPGVSAERTRRTRCTRCAGPHAPRTGLWQCNGPFCPGATACFAQVLLVVGEADPPGCRLTGPPRGGGGTLQPRPPSGRGAEPVEAADAYALTVPAMRPPSAARRRPGPAPRRPPSPGHPSTQPRGAPSRSPPD